MTRYLVKITYKATENNKNFAGETHVYYEGKGEKTVKDDTSYFPWRVEEYGYKRECDAKRNYHFHNPTTETCNGVVIWEKQVEVVKVEI